MNKRICIIEDDPDIRFMLRRTLTAHGYEVEEFADAYPLFEKDDHWPQLFILDIEIPGINGLEICNWIKSNPATREIPVMFLSGSPELKVLASSTEASGYLAKPFKSADLLLKIREYWPSGPHAKGAGLEMPSGRF